MLPLTKRLYEHPRTGPDLSAAIERMADWDQFEAMDHITLALYIGLLSGALLHAFEELDRLEVKH